MLFPIAGGMPNGTDLGSMKKGAGVAIAAVAAVGVAVSVVNKKEYQKRDNPK